MGSSLAELEETIARISASSNNEEITQLDSRIQALQKSDKGWELADGLLASANTSVQFYGALTYTVKINQAVDLDTGRLVIKLLTWFKRIVALQQFHLVTSKFCHTLATLYLRDDAKWINCIRHVMYNFCWPGDDAMAEEEMDPSWNVSDIASRMTNMQVIATLEFASVLADEAKKHDTGSYQKHAKTYMRLQNNIQDVGALTSFALVNPTFEDAGLRTFGTWVLLSQVAWESSRESLQVLRDLFIPALQCIRPHEASSPAVQTVIDILEYFPSFLPREHLDALCQVILSDHGRETLGGLKDDDLDAIEFCELLLSYGNNVTQDLARKPAIPENAQILEFIHELPKVSGSEDYDVLAPAVEFWNNYSECLMEEIQTLAISNTADLPEGDRKPEPEWLRLAKRHLLQACEENWAKAHYPDAETVAAWQAENVEEHYNFRSEVGDLFQASQTVVPGWVLPRFTNLASRFVQAQDWASLEASLWAINTVSDYADLEPDTKDEQCLRAIISSTMFPLIVGTNAKNTVGLRKTAIDMLGHYSNYFENRPEHLPSVLGFLFDCLETSEEATVTVAKSIATLCSSCRKALTNDINGFVEQYERFLSWPTATTHIKEKIMFAIACIVQATSPKFEGLEKLLRFVERDIQSAIKFLHHGDGFDAQKGSEMALCSLLCLAKVGKGLQAPSDEPIDLEADDDQQDQWMKGPDQQRICSDIFKVVRLIPNGEVIDAACEVFKSGFPERTPGPFTLPAEYVIDFILNTNTRTVHLESVLSMACALLTTRMPSDQVLRLLLHIGQLISDLENPSEDPEIAYGLIDVASRALSYNDGIVLGVSPAALLQSVIQFTLEALRGSDRMPKQAACVFWSTVLALANPSINEVINYFGPALVAAIVHQITGQASRSDLDFIYDPIKKIIMAGPGAKVWFEQALADNSVVDENARARIDVGRTRKFVAQLIAARGGKATNGVVKTFWAECKGTVSGFTV
ncbi:MAG: hypothetical protein M1820_004797 [Bogoriella megaspora]|nr:MAG: hypothetical protein M1820_004797 [Bogoriella megaspora]